MPKTIICCAIALHSVTVAVAGDLAPPSAPAPTMKSLEQVEPRIPIGPLTTPGDADSVYRITQPGSYYLTGDVIGESVKDGIAIVADDVSLDLMGFTVRGVGGSNTGITVTGVTSVSLANGVVRDWREWGAKLLSGGAVVRNVRFVGNSFGGLQVNSGVVEGCAAADNGGAGFQVSAAAFLNCTARGNGSFGFSLGSNSTATNCSAIFNGSDGFHALGAGILTGCTSQQNGGDGFDIGLGSAVVECVARGNTQNGVRANNSLVDRCVVDLNSEHGVRITEDSVVRDSLCSANGSSGAVGHGILVTGSDNRIEGNSLIDNDIGLRIDAGGNIVMKNSASGNGTNYQFVANNYYGRIVDMTVAGTPAVTGNSATNQIGTAEPWSNFAY